MAASLTRLQGPSHALFGEDDEPTGRDYYQQMREATSDTERLFVLERSWADHRRETISHLVQDSKEIDRILNEVLPPDEYYEELTKALRK